MEDKERIAELEAELVKAKKPKTLTLKVTPKGCIGLYGLRRFPPAFYPQEWEKIFTMVEAIKEFEIEHRSELTYK